MAKFLKVIDHNNRSVIINADNIIDVRRDIYDGMRLSKIHLENDVITVQADIDKIFAALSNENITVDVR